MAKYRQYTQCVDVSNFNPQNPYTQAALVDLGVTLPVAVIPVLMAIAGASRWCLFLLIEIFGIAGVIGYYCYWWLYRRLILHTGADRPSQRQQRQSDGDRYAHRHPDPSQDVRSPVLHCEFDGAVPFTTCSSRHRRRCYQLSLLCLPARFPA